MPDYLTLFLLGTVDPDNSMTGEHGAGLKKIVVQHFEL